MRLSDNIKLFRKKFNFTQEQLAETLNVKRSAIGSYEEGRATPPLEVLLKMTKVFEVSLDELVSAPSSKRPKTFTKEAELKILSITVDQEDNEWIDLVPEKASAGYTAGYSDPEYISDLPKFRMPNLRNGTFRAFEIKGDSMLPLQSGSIVIGEYTLSLSEINSGQTYVIVTKNDGIVYKRIINQIHDSGKLILQSDNPVYTPYEIDPNDVIEIWHAKAYISSVFPEPEISMTQVMSIIQDMRTEMDALKGKQPLS